MTVATACPALTVVKYVGSLEEGVLLVPPGSLLAAVVSLLPNVVVRGVFAFCLMELVCLVTEELLVETPRDAVPLGEAHVLRTFVPCSW